MHRQTTSDWRRKRYATDEEYREKKKQEQRDYYASRVKTVIPQTPEEREKFRQMRIDQKINEFVANLRKKKETE